VPKKKEVDKVKYPEAKPPKKKKGRFGQEI
jgi:hypothetical protein